MASGEMMRVERKLEIGVWAEGRGDRMWCVRGIL